jgi:CheY-like chemotaxis protein
MSEKRILIVDDEAAILSVLKSSLKKLGVEYEVATAPDGQGALEQLKQRPFDLVITDYKMAGMDGLELLKAVRTLQPKARTILMTAYGNDKVEAETRRLQAYCYLIKPLEIDNFRQIVKSALNDMAISRPGILILSDERYKQIVLALNRLQMDIGARCVVLADAAGHPIARTGNLDKFPLERIVPLLGGCIAGLGEVGRVLDGDEDIINLVYRESSTENLYVINIGAQLLLIIVVDRGPYNSKLGTVWYSAQQVASMLSLKLDRKEYADPEELFDNGLETAVSDELDKLLSSSNSAKARSNLKEHSDHCSNPGHVQLRTDGKIETQPSPSTYKQAAQAGLIPDDLGGKQERKSV